jgi:hypothetical protein
MSDLDGSFAKTTLPSPSVTLPSRVDLTEAIANVHYIKPYKIGGNFFLALIKILFYPLPSLRQGGGDPVEFLEIKNTNVFNLSSIMVPLLTEGGGGRRQVYRGSHLKR